MEAAADRGSSFELVRDFWWWSHLEGGWPFLLPTKKNLAPMGWGVRTSQSNNSSSSNSSKIGSLSSDLRNKVCKIMNSYSTCSWNHVLAVKIQKKKKNDMKRYKMSFIKIRFCNQSSLYIQTLKPTLPQQKSFIHHDHVCCEYWM